ncbi:MAG: AsmA family protein [Planctomycetota bacterium]|jgi:hypothetical protein|nr:AsmA family protein [Planctomycetota bacterium]
MEDIPTEARQHLPAKRHRGLKKAFAVIVVLFVLFAAAIYFLPHILPVDTIRGIAKTQARETLGMDLDFRNLGFGWNGSVIVEGVTLAPEADKGVPASPALLRIDEVRASVSMPALLSGRVIVSNLAVTGFTASVRREKDGSLNLPDFSRLAALATTGSPPGQASPRVRLAALADGGTSAPAALPPVEIHRVTLTRGDLSFSDAERDLALDIAVDAIQIDGASLNDPFILSGRILPYPDDPGKGEFVLSGKAALIRDNAFNPDGEAVLEIDAVAFAPGELLKKAGLGDLLPAGAVSGKIKLAYAGRKAILALSGFALTGAEADPGLGRRLRLPDSKLDLAAEYAPDQDSITFSDAALTSAAATLEGRGRFEGIAALAAGGFPAAAAEFSGGLDFAAVSAFLGDLGMAPPRLPGLTGKGRFSGRISVPAGHGSVLAPTVSVEFSEGDLGIREAASGIEAEVGLAGTVLKATADVGDAFDLKSSLSMTRTPVSLRVPQIGGEPVRLTLHGGLAATVSGKDEAAAEIRFADTELALPATPWSEAVRVINQETRLTYNFFRDELSLAALNFTIDGGIEGGITSATATGLLTDNPRGRADVRFSARLERLAQLLRPLFPPEIETLAGNAAGDGAIVLENGKTRVNVKTELEGAGLALGLAQGAAGAKFEKIAVSVAAGADVVNPSAVSVEALEVDNAGALVDFRTRDGDFAVAGRIGATRLQSSGRLHAGNLLVELSRLEIDGQEFVFAIDQDGKRTAGLAIGRTRASFGSEGVVAPLSGEGDFRIPSLAAETERLVFSRLGDGQRRDDSDFGKIRLDLGLEGYVGSEKRQAITLRAASFRSRPLAANARGRADLSGGELAMQYAAAVAPSELTSLFGFLELPPALLSQAKASGEFVWNGSSAVSKGMFQGELKLTTGEVNPFEMNHEIAAGYKADTGTVSLNVRRLDGVVKSGSGEPALSLAAAPAVFSLRRGDAQGTLDIDFRGSAGAGRTMILGLIGLFPHLRDYSNLVYESQMGGIYETRLRLQGNGAKSLALHLSGIWQGAALSIGDTRHIAEAGKLGAAMEGEYSFAENRLHLSKLVFQSDSGQIQALGTADIVLIAGADAIPTGLAAINLGFRFRAIDLARTALVFPGILAPEMGLKGSVEGAIGMSGNVSAVRIGEGKVTFRDFQIRLGENDLSAPAGTAGLDATLSIRLERAAAVQAADSPYAPLRFVDIADGAASLAGAVLDGKPIEVLRCEFQLEDGLFTLKSGEARLGGQEDGEASASGRIDFKPAAPAVTLRLAGRNIPLSQVNSQLADYLSFGKGILNLPAEIGQTAGVSFSGFSEDGILGTLRLDNFTFATGPVSLTTGPILNSELDKARGLMHQEVTEGNKSRTITLTSVSGMAVAAGDGVISFPAEHPINVVGDNTGDFRVQGIVSADHSMNMDFYVVGKLENLIGFSLPNIIPNLRSGTDEEKRGFMAKMNQNAAKGHYMVNVSGNLERPNLSGIGLLAGRFVTDIVAAAPAQVIGGVLNLARDAPGAIIGAPGNIGRNLGRVFGLERHNEEAGTGAEANQATPEQVQPQPDQPQQHQQRGLRLPFPLIR